MTKIFWIFGLFNAANGLWMLLAPRAWYYGLPARVTDTGPLNVHFVRDIGAAFLTLGIAFCFTAPRASQHRGVVLAAAGFYTLHGLIHVFDLAAGRLDIHHWLRRFSSRDRPRGAVCAALVAEGRLMATALACISRLAGGGFP